MDQRDELDSLSAQVGHQRKAKKVIDLLVEGGSQKDEAHAAKALKLINAEC